MDRRNMQEDASVAAMPTCPECGGAVETIKHDDVFRFGDGDSAVDLPVTLPVRRCSACDVEFLDREAERIKHEALCGHHGVLTPWQVREIRERYGLSRAAFARLTGLGEATLARWESGALMQTVGNDRYLRMLSAPGGIESLKAVVRLAQSEQMRSKSGQVSGRRFRCLEPTDQTRDEGRDFRLYGEAA